MSKHKQKRVALYHCVTAEQFSYVSSQQRRFNIAMTKLLVRFLLLTLSAECFANHPPHILFVLVDDYGWSDVGFHGSKIHTPNIDRLASEGVILDNYYVQPICSPTRSALMSGRYPIHTGLQHGVIKPIEPYGLPLDFTILPQMLKKAGYATHIVGKWHLGFFEWPYTPTYRGFDTHYGFYVGAEDHFTHEREGILDFRDNKKPERNISGKYSVRVMAERVKEIVSTHNPNQPLFLYLPFHNVHGPTQAPQEYIDKYSFIQDRKRRIYAAMVDIMDEAVGNVTKAFIDKGLWENTLMVLSTDNGGIPKAGGYNWPLRGHKATLWEGGVRGVGFVRGSMLEKKGAICKELLHVTDWYPTLVKLAGIEVNDNSPVPLDGMDVWETISSGKPSPRREILHNIDPRIKCEKGKHLTGEGIALRMDEMKLLMNVPNTTWFKPPELGGEYCHSDLQIEESRETIKIALYNITADPAEHYDLSSKLPDVVAKMRKRVEYYEKGLVPPLKPAHGDPQARKTAEKNGIWGPWR